MALITVESIITLDGSSPRAERRVIEGDSIVQLSSFFEKDFFFPPYGFKKTKLFIKNVVIYDDNDVWHLLWFIRSKFCVDMTLSYIGFEMLRKLADGIKGMEKDGWSLKLKLPWGGGSRELESLEYAKQIFDKAGVQY